MSDKILFVDDRYKEEGWEKALRPKLPKEFDLIFEDKGYKILDRLKEDPDIKLVILDLTFPNQPKQGHEIFNEIKESYPEIPVIIISGFDDASVCRDMMRAPFKPFNCFFKGEIIYDQLISDIQRAIEYYQVKQDSIRKTSGGQVVGKSKLINDTLRLVEKVSRTEAPVLIRGETGTGKELVARAIHFNSLRKEKPFVTVDCAVLSENLIESELFGHVRGAFTGATKDKIGLLEIGDGGTVFLDEIGNVSLSTQAKLLRVLQEKVFKAVGGTKDKRLDIRFIAATNKDLETMIKEGTFREDLYYRLNVVPIFIPPLRERKEDIPLLINYFISKYALEHKIYLKVDNFRELVKHSQMEEWKGNVRELENRIERALVLSDGDTLDISHFNQKVTKQREINLNLMKDWMDSTLTFWATKVFSEKEEEKIFWKHINQYFGPKEMKTRILYAIVDEYQLRYKRVPSARELAILLKVPGKDPIGTIRQNLKKGSGLRKYKSLQI